MKQDVATGSAAIVQLKTAQPKARLNERQGRVVSAYGAPLAKGASARESADSFRQQHASAFGADPADLVAHQSAQATVAGADTGIGLMFDRQTGTYKYRLHRYRQVRDGIPVHGSELRTVTRNADEYPVVWAHGTTKPLGNFRPSKVAAAAAADPAKVAAAVRRVWASSGYPGAAPSAFTQTGAGRDVIYAGDAIEARAPVMASEFKVASTNPPSTWTVVADAASGEILHVENGEIFENILGTVRGNVTAGDRAMPCDPAVVTPFPAAQITAAGLGDFYTDATGAFTVINPGTAAVALTSPVGGTYFDVTDYGGVNDTVTQSVVPPGPAQILHNGTVATESVLAQSNAYVQANDGRNFLLKYNPNFPTISTQTNFPISVNRTDLYCPGNAWYSPSEQSMNFCVSGGSYNNTAFASVIHHEYGHHIVQVSGSGQGAYGEGIGDSFGLLMSDVSGLGFGFYAGQCTTPLRDANNDCQYSATSCSSCGSEVHACGKLLAGISWSMRQAFAAAYPTTYRDLLSNLLINSIPMHSGTTIDGSIAVDLLTLDDNDANLDNGTPHYDQICAGFSAHGISCPELKTGLSVSPKTAFSSQGPVGGPFTPGFVTYTLTNLGPEASMGYQVLPVATTPWLGITNPTGTLGIGEQAQVVLTIDSSQANLLPYGKYSAKVNFVNTTSGVGSLTQDVNLKVGVPTPVYTETFAGGLGGFTVDSPGTNNLWHASTSCADSQPGHTSPQSLYFGQDSGCTFSTSSRVYGTVTSPNIVVQDTSDTSLKFNYYLATEKLGTYDSARVLVSVNGGAYTIVASNNAGGTLLTDGSGAWQSAQIDLTSLLSGLTAATLKVQFSFDSVDSVANGYTGFVVDDVEVLAKASACSTNANCADGLICNGEETCDAGVCKPGTPMACDDGIACTVDSCSETTAGCIATANNAACSDGQACNGSEICNPLSGCTSGTALNCDDSNDCTTDSCDNAVGCQNVTLSCNDTNACTADACVSGAGCQNTPISCDDGSVCTIESCDVVAGCLSTPLDCNDNNACTTDSCNAASGCAHTALSCDDGNACTVDSCSPTTGCSNTAFSCDDGNECTTDTCDAAGGCTHTPNTGGCTDDGDLCTDDVCSAGSCTHVDNGTCTTPKAFIEVNGQVVMEAEHFMTNTGRSAHTWDLLTNTAASNGQMMSSNPNNGAAINTGYVTTSPQLDYTIKFTTLGTYYVWLRTIGPNGNDDSCHAGLDSTAVASADRMGSFSAALSWSRSTMDGPVATINVTSAGLHNFNIWMREDGLRIDKIVLTTNSSYTPNGAGPTESEQQGGTPQCSSAAECDDANSCTTDTCTAGVCGHAAVANGTACADDGNACTTDACTAGACTHVAIPNCGNSPCSAYCSNPVSFSGNFQSGNLGTAATCHQTTGTLNGGNCGNFVSPRKLYVNGQAMSCGNGNWSSIPAKVNGGYCVYTTAGDYSWAYFATW